MKRWMIGIVAALVLLVGAVDVQAAGKAVRDQVGPVAECDGDGPMGSALQALFRFMFGDPANDPFQWNRGIGRSNGAGTGYGPGDGTGIGDGPYDGSGDGLGDGDGDGICDGTGDGTCDGTGPN